LNGGNDGRGFAGNASQYTGASVTLDKEGMDSVDTIYRMIRLRQTYRHGHLHGDEFSGLIYKRKARQGDQRRLGREGAHCIHGCCADGDRSWRRASTRWRRLF